MSSVTRTVHVLQYPQIIYQHRDLDIYQHFDRNLTGNVDDLKSYRWCQTSGFIIGFPIFTQNKSKKMINSNDIKFK